MEFYLGPTHWLDAFPRVLDSHLESIFAILDSLAAPVAKDDAPFRFPGLQIAGIADLLDAGWTKKQITLREIELDYLCVSPDKYEMNDMTEGTLDDWVDSVGETADVSCALMKDDEMIRLLRFLSGRLRFIRRFALRQRYDKGKYDGALRVRRRF